MARKKLSKRTRFEVFKRDGFKCQYCGASSPDVLLVLDHIVPVASGGDDGILNLITACETCNAGKAAVPLADSTAVKKQLGQIRRLAERREQMEMLVQWRDGLQSLEDEKLAVLIDKVNARLAPSRHTLNEACIARMRWWLKKFGFESALYGVQQAHLTEPGPLFAQMEQFAAAAAKVAREPQLRDWWRIRALLRARRFNYGPEWSPVEDMRRAFKDGYTVEEIGAAASEAEDYGHFRQLIGYRYR